jgi:hypothetical protein
MLLLLRVRVRVRVRVGVGVVVMVLLHATSHGVLSQWRRPIHWGRHSIVIVGTGSGSHCYAAIAAIATIGTEAEWGHIERKKGWMRIHFQ